MAQSNYEYFEDLPRTSIRYRDFAGKGFDGDTPGKVRPAICIWIDDEEQAERMKRDGWNISYKPRQGYEEDQPCVRLQMFWKAHPTAFMKVGNSPNQRLTEETISCLDNIDILSVDIKAHWFETQKNRNVFHTGCLDTVRIVVREDRLERKMRMEDEAAVDEEVPFE